MLAGSLEDSEDIFYQEPKLGEKVFKRGTVIKEPPTVWSSKPIVQANHLVVRN